MANYGQTFKHRIAAWLLPPESALLEIMGLNKGGQKT